MFFKERSSSESTLYKPGCIFAASGRVIAGEMEADAADSLYDIDLSGSQAACLDLN